MIFTKTFYLFNIIKYQHEYESEDKTNKEPQIRQFKTICDLFIEIHYISSGIDKSLRCIFLNE